MQRARETIQRALNEAKSPAVLWSGGKDSQLLLHLVREIDESVSVIWFRPPDDRFARRMILEMDLDVWSWQPSDVYVLPNEKGLSLIREQSFGQPFPLVLDIEDGQRCIGDFFPERTPQLFPHFDVLFLGYRDSDFHRTLGGSGFCPEDGWTLGKARMFAPLRHMSDGDVWKAIRELNIPIDEERYENGTDPETLQACTKCLQAGEGKVYCLKEEKEIDRIQWEPGKRLNEFRQRFGLRAA